MAANSPQEQLMLELLNRARMNPAAEAARFGIALNQGLPAGTISTTPKQVLAMNDLLVISSDRHSNWMLVNDQFSHEEPANFPNGRTGLEPGDRMTAAGYVFTGSWSNGENISWTGTTAPTLNLTDAIISQHEDLFRSAGHRENILADDFREVGVGQQLGQFTAQTSQGPRVFTASMVTQNFALSGDKLFITGVVYNDTVVNDNFFTVGEQTAGRTVGGTGPVTDTTGAGGGYELGFTSTGLKNVKFNLDGGTVQVAVTLGTTNLKVDIVNGKEVWTNANLSLVSGPVTELHALGILGISLTGAAGNESLFGNVAANRLTGGAGNDTLDGAAGADRMLGQAGNDIYKVDNAGDVVDETGGTGTDVVQSTITFNLGNTARVIGAVEALQLTGSAAISAIGNALANAITGNAANNGLNGAAGNDLLTGGAGVDTLTGSTGNDVFVFNVAPSLANRDVLADFTNAAGNDDMMRLENAVMPGVGGPGALAANLFFAGASAHDADDRIVYNQTNGIIYYDANGNAAGGFTPLATLNNKPVLTAADFVVV